MQEPLRRSCRSPQFRAGLGVECSQERLLLTVLKEKDLSRMDHGRRCGAKVEIDALRWPLLLPQQRAIERIAVHAEILTERNVQPFAVRERRLRRVRVLAMPSSERQSLV